MCICPQSAVADRNVSETVYMAESLYLRYDIPFIMQPVMQALARRGQNVSAINTTHALFTVRSARYGPHSPCHCHTSLCQRPLTLPLPRAHFHLLLTLSHKTSHVALKID